MSRDRSIIHDEPLLRLKVATRKAVKAVHGTQLAGEIAGAKQQRISDCQAPNTGDFLRLDEVQAIEEAGRGGADFPAITRALARNHGFALLPLIDENAALGDSDWHTAIAAVSREANEAVARICSALPEGVTKDEICELEIVEEIDEAIGALARLRSLAEATVRAGR